MNGLKLRLPETRYESARKSTSNDFFTAQWGRGHVRPTETMCPDCARPMDIWAESFDRCPDCAGWDDAGAID